MSELLENILRCPTCGASVAREGNCLACQGARRHCFDFSAAGYVNLAAAKASGGGDDAELIRARSAFLETGHYAPVARAILAALQTHAKGNTVLDAGCGEGYYSLQMARNGMNLVGIDLSKRGIMHAAKAAKREGANALFAVAGIFDLPVRDASLDAVASIFAPVCEAEFCRVLKPGGILVLAGAGPDHLFSLKSVLYDTPYQNEPRADAPTGMQLLASERVRYVAEMENGALCDLFAMTPYFYRTSRAGRERLLAKDVLCVDVDVEISVYRKV